MKRMINPIAHGLSLLSNSIPTQPIMENPIKYKTAATELGATKTRDKKYVDNAKQMTTDTSIF